MSPPSARTMKRYIAGLLVLGVASYSSFPAATATGAEAVAERVKRIVSEHLGIDAAKITLESELVRDLQADSLDLVELVMALENEFKKPFSDEVSGALVTVGDAASFIESGKIPPARPPGSSCMPAKSGQIIRLPCGRQFDPSRWDAYAFAPAYRYRASAREPTPPRRIARSTNPSTRR